MGKRKTYVDIAKVEALAAHGMSRGEIAAALGIHRNTLTICAKENKEIEAAIERGTAKGIAVATSKLFEKVQAGDLGAICFFLKCRGGRDWQERRVYDMTSSDGSMSPAPAVAIDLTCKSQAELLELTHAAFGIEARGKDEAKAIPAN